MQLCKQSMPEQSSQPASVIRPVSVSILLWAKKGQDQTGQICCADLQLSGLHI